MVRSEFINFIVKDLGVSLSQYGQFSYKGVKYENALPLYATIISDPMFSADLMIEYQRKNAWNFEFFFGNTENSSRNEKKELELISNCSSERNER